MLFLKKKLLFIIILTSISKLCFSHEFWIDPMKFQFMDNEIFEANILIGENFEGSPVPFSKNYFKISFLHYNQNKIKIKGRLGDIPALKIRKLFSGLNIIQIESITKYIEYNDLTKFEIFTTKKGYPNLVKKHKENDYPDNFVESYKRYAKSLVSVENINGNDVDTNMELELIFLDNPLKNLKKNKRVLLEYQNKFLSNHQVTVMSFRKDYFKKEYFKTNNEGFFEFIFKKDTKYLIESVVIIEGSNRKKDKYAKWHSLWASYTLKP